MKMNFAGFSTDPNAKPENFRFNCLRNRSCHKEYFIPISSACDFMMYFELPFIPETYSIELVDCCSSVSTPATAINYVFGEHTGGYYGVIGGLLADTPPQMFYVKAVMIAYDGREAVYFSNDFEIVTCERLTKVTSCYNDPAVGSQAFDINGVYYGFPIGSNWKGNHDYRYYHFINVRKGSVIGSKTKLSFGLFNYNRTYRTQASQEYNFFSESVPEFYKEEIVSVIARGNILIHGKQYQLAEEIDISINDEDSQRWGMNIKLNKTIFNYFSCKTTLCNFDPCAVIAIPPPEVCCSPSIITVGVEVVSDPPTDPGYTCNRYLVAGNEENSTYSFVDCVTGDTGEQVLGRATVLVCSRTRPTGDGISIAESGSCNS